MLDKIQSRIIIILGLSGVFACILSFSFLSAIPQFEFIFPLEKGKIFEKADRFLSLEGITSEPLVKKSVILSNRGGVIYIQKMLGIEKASRLLESLPLYYWQIGYAYPRDIKVILPSGSQKRIIKIIINPANGKIIGFNRLVPQEEYKYLRILSKKESTDIAYDFFSLIKFEITDFRMTKYSSMEGKYAFEWEKNIPELKVAKLKVKLEISGDKIGNFSYLLEIPATELKKLKTANLADLLLFIILNLSIIALGVFVLITLIKKRKELEWKFGLIFALLILLSSLINFFKIGYYKGLHQVLFLFVTILSCVISFFWIMIISSVAKLFAKESGLRMFPVGISSSVLLGYIFVFTGLGLTLFSFVFVQNIFKPLNTLGFYSFFSEFPTTRFSFLIAPLLSLSAGVCEEIFFRALMISYLKKILKKTIWAVVLSALVWSFIHVTPIGYSDVYPAFIKGIILLPMGVLLGYIFIRFGIVCAIVTHYLHDLIVIGAVFLEFSNYRNANENIIAMLIAAVLPLAIAIYFRIKESNA